jgi:hypothetical protein
MVVDMVRRSEFRAIRRPTPRHRGRHYIHLRDDLEAAAARGHLYLSKKQILHWAKLEKHNRLACTALDEWMLKPKSFALTYLPRGASCAAQAAG